MRGSDTVVSVVGEAYLHPLAALVHSFLTASGVAAVVVALAVGAGATRSERRSVEGLNRDLVVVSATSPSTSGVEVGLPSPSLTTDDVQALGVPGYIPGAVTAVPTAAVRTDVTVVSRSWETDVVGTTAGFATVRGYSIAQGRFVSQADVDEDAPVVVVGQTLVDQLFNGADPVGARVEIEDHEFQVIGVLKRLGVSGQYDQDDIAVIPISTAWSALLQSHTIIDQVLVRATSPSRTPAVEAEVTKTLLARHHIVNPQAADFQVQTVRDLLERPETAASATKRALGLAGLLLLLGGAIHLATLGHDRVGRWTYDRTNPGEHLATRSGQPQPSNGFATRTLLADALGRGAVATVVGLVLALVYTTAVYRVVKGLPAPEFTWTAVVAGVVCGLLSAVLAPYGAVDYVTGTERQAMSEPHSDLQ